MCSYMGGVKNSQNYPYIINEWSLRVSNKELSKNFLETLRKFWKNLREFQKNFMIF